MKMLENVKHPVDYIQSLNKLIWNEKQIGTIYECFKHNVLVHVYGRSIYGRDQLMEEVVDLMAGFPDMQRQSEKIIWAVDGKSGFHVSERFTWTGHAKGYTVYGAPSGAEVSVSGIANYYIHNGYIAEMWYTEDAIRIPGQLGIDLLDALEMLTDISGHASFSGRTSGENVRLNGEFPPEEFGENNGRFSDTEYFVRKNIHDIFNRRMLGQVREFFHRDFVYHGPNGREFQADADAYIQDKLSLLQAFPDLSVRVHDFYSLYDPEKKQYDTACRFTILGTHSGNGIFGRATGKRIYLPGITQQTVKNEKVTEQWTSFDELSLRCELYAAGADVRTREQEAAPDTENRTDNERTGGSYGE